MKPSSRTRRSALPAALVGAALVGTALAGAALVGPGVLPAAAAAPERASELPQLHLLGSVDIPTGTQFDGTEVGGLSGLVYDTKRKRYAAISDDRSSRNDARYYELTINLADGALDDGDVEFTDVTTLTDDGAAYPEGAIDPEGIALTEHGVLVSSEGNASALLGPSVEEFDACGEHLGGLTVPRYYEPTADGRTGIRNNLAFESLTRTPHGRVVTATENALAQDGPIATLTEGSRSRLAVFNPASGRVIGEYVYLTDPIPEAPVPADGWADNGLVELVALGEDRFLAMERAFAAGVGNDVRIYEVRLDRSRRITGNRQTAGDTKPLEKRLVADLAEDFGIAPDNLEGMALGPKLPDGRQSLILVSDNNFSTAQKTQVLAFAIS
ncbi:esterase-like activity of phytase family protein [Promicromonospora sp. Populi]|uniref:esterase-like activity of phytase family protein n=1 Tax=Promicromonospora sp. Populi TaxID=3239420 RepID=UPI0034E1CADB